MRLDSALKYISAQNISTLFDALRAIAREFSDARAFMAVPVSYLYETGTTCLKDEVL